MGNSAEKERVDFHLVQIVLACRNLAKTSTGGLIVITRTHDLEFYAQSGEQINATISSRLVENIFLKTAHYTMAQ